jgi:hypothetical protein
VLARAAKSNIGTSFGGRGYEADGNLEKTL